MNQVEFHLHGVCILVEKVTESQAVVNSMKKDRAKREETEQGREGGCLGMESGKASEERWPRRGQVHLSVLESAEDTGFSTEAQNQHVQTHSVGQASTQRLLSGQK